VTTPARDHDQTDPWDEPEPELAVALRQLAWYGRHRDNSRRAYQVNEVLILLTSASATVAAALKAPALATSILAAATVVLAGLYKVLDAQENWVAFGIAWSQLQVAVNQYRLLPEAGRDQTARAALIATVNDVIAADTGRWASRRRSLAEAET
jgi:hypothetical protein